MSAIRENCGVFGIYSHDSCVTDIYQGIDLLQHRGQEYCGISTFDDHIRQITHHGKVASSFTDQELDYLTGTWGIGHVSLKERQPVRYQSKLGDIALAFSGNIMNAEEIREDMLGRGKAFFKNYDIEIISKVILEAGDPVAGITALSEKIKGAYSLVLLAKEGVYATRDVFGFRPLILGQNTHKYAVASESRAIQNLEMKTVRDVRPGEILLIDQAGFHVLKQVPSPRRAHCAFEWAYTASVDSVVEGVYVQAARNSLGGRLAKRDEEEGVPQADLVAPVPMSGLGHAIGYHMRSGLPYQEVFLYNRYADRSYTQANQGARERMAKRKLSVLEHAVRDKRIILCDDSIVRGTQILYKVIDLKNAGAREVHVRIACPPLMYPCDFGISTRTCEELKARMFIKDGDVDSLEELRRLETWMAKQIGADSVKYNSSDSFVEALGIPRENLCLKCFSGLRPTDAG